MPATASRSDGFVTHGVSTPVSMSAASCSQLNCSAPPVAPSRAAPALGVGNGTGRDRRGLRELAVRRCRECSELLALAIRHRYTLADAHHAYVSRCAPSSLCAVVAVLLLVRSQIELVDYESSSLRSNLSSPISKSRSTLSKSN